MKDYQSIIKPIPTRRSNNRIKTTFKVIRCWWIIGVINIKAKDRRNNKYKIIINKYK